MLLRSRKIKHKSRAIPLHEHKVPRLEFLACSKVVSPKVPNGLKRIFWRLLELSLQKKTVQIFEYLGPVHTNPFSNEMGAVLLRFQNGLRPHLSFSPVHTTTPYPF